MQNTLLVDAGLMIALFNAKDPLHESAKLAVQALPRNAKLFTIWPCVTEACFFLDRKGKGSLLAWLARGAAKIQPIEPSALSQIVGLLDRYPDREVDLADACLIWLAGSLGTNRVLTTDRRDFDIYRTPNGMAFERVWVEYGE